MDCAARKVQQRPLANVAQTRRDIHQTISRALVAARPPSQASARPSFQVRHAGKRGRDVGLAESGFLPSSASFADHLVASQ